MMRLSRARLEFEGLERLLAGGGLLDLGVRGPGGRETQASLGHRSPLKQRQEMEPLSPGRARTGGREGWGRLPGALRILKGFKSSKAAEGGSRHEPETGVWGKGGGEDHGVEGQWGPGQEWPAAPQWASVGSRAIGDLGEGSWVGQWRSQMAMG